MMEKIYEALRDKYKDLNDLAKDGICERMKELGHIEFNSGRSFPFTTIDGEYDGVIVYELRYDEETGDVIAYDETFREWSIQEDGTVDGCIELLYYIEEGAFKKVDENL